MNATGPTAIAPFMVPNMPFEDKDLALLNSDRPGADDRRRIIAPAGQFGRRADRLCQGQSRQGELRLVRPRRHQPSGGASCSGALPASTSCMCPIAVRRRPSRICWRGRSSWLSSMSRCCCRTSGSGNIKALAATSKTRSAAAARCADHGRGRAAHGALGQLVRACRAGRRSQTRSRSHSCRRRRGPQDQGSSRPDDELRAPSIRPMTPAGFTDFVRLEREKWGPVVKASGAKME